VLGSVVADASGNWSFTPSTALADGQYVFTVTAQDAAGNSATSDSHSITVTTSISKPTITDVIDDVGPTQGSIANNGVTDDNMPTLTGKADAGTTVTIKNGNTVLGSVVADANGNWSFTPSTALADGHYVFTVIAQDAAGNSATSDSHVIDIAATTIKPTITSVFDDIGSITGVVANKGVTDDNKPTLNGKAEAGSTVTIKNGNTVLGTAVTDHNGNWSFTPGTILVDGEYNFTVVATSKTGIVSEPSDSYIVIVDTVIAKPTITAVIDDFGVSTGTIVNNGKTDDRTPTLKGTAEAGATVVIKTGATVLGSAVADSSGNWSFTPSVDLPAGAHTFTVVATDIAGNTSVASNSYTINIEGSKFTYTVWDDYGPTQGLVNNNTTTDDKVLKLIFKEVWGYVEVFIDGISVAKVQLANSNVTNPPPTSWYTPTLSEGQHQITAVNWNNGMPWVVYEDFYVTVVAPKVTPVIETVIDDVGPVTGSIANHGATDDTKPTLSGKVDPGVSVRISDGGTVIGGVAADSSGKWSFTPPKDLALGEHVFTVSAIDKTGNTIAVSESFTITIVATAAQADELNALLASAPLSAGVDAISTESAEGEERSLWMLFDDGSATGVLSTEHLHTVQGGNGDDVIGIRDTSFALIDGGAGVDTVLLDGKNMTLDLDALVDRIHGIEKIDLGEGTSNRLSLSADALEHLNPSTVSEDDKKQLVINGDGSNNVDLLETLSEPWMQAGQAEIDGVAYHTFVSGSVELLVEQNIQITLI
ncbi:Ig-like domain-containing protein, partial [Aeromonas hydrophila]|uniref:Ig-like domain-containing protein n=1 Tax=Aeromonas hydrophila TaxID=644 RepID=UPI0022B03069